uniref:Uncharacterized protein n=1 Tax=Leersia perrieri TaxID=77586 RepID=A0A0D9WJY3_9ORYZ
MQLLLRAWEKTQQFRIEMMADKQAAKKVKYLQHMEQGYIQDFINNIVDRQDVPEYIQQSCLRELKVPDEIRLHYIRVIEERNGDTSPKNKSLINVVILLSIGAVVFLSSFLVPESLKVVFWVASIVICGLAVLSYDHGSLIAIAPTETHDLENPPITN